MLDKKTILAAVKAQFKLDWDGDHGCRHWGRVYGQGVLLCRTEPGADVDVVKAFALLHDACRIHEITDPDHGPRAAFFARRLWSDGLLDLTPEQMDTLTYAIRNHSISALSTSSVTVQVCTDADRLDLGRVGKKPDPKRLFTASARSLAARLNAKVMPVYA